MHHHLDQPILSIKEIDLSPGRVGRKNSCTKTMTKKIEEVPLDSKLESFPAFRLGVPSGGDADLDVDDPGGDLEVLADREVNSPKLHYSLSQSQSIKILPEAVTWRRSCRSSTCRSASTDMR